MCVNKESNLILVLLQAIFNAEKTVIDMLLEGYQLMVDGIAIQQILLKYAICLRPEEDALR